MKTENLTKKQAIDFLTEYAKCGIHLNYPSNPEKSLNKMEECIAVLTDSGSVAAPKEDWMKRMDALNELMEPTGLKLVVLQSGEWDLQQIIKRPR